MPLARSPRTVRSREKDGSHSPALEDGDGPPAKRRKVFLQTMGQQLREMEALRNGPTKTNERFANTRSVYFIRSVFDGLSAGQHEQQQAIQTPESDVVPGDETDASSHVDGLSARSLWTSSEVLSESAATDSFGFNDLIDWTQSYFDNWHPAFPFLLAPDMLRFFERITQNSFSASRQEDSHQISILRSIISISIADRRQSKQSSKPVPSWMAFRTFQDAIKCVGSVLAGETTLKSLQVVLSVMLFLLSMLRYNAASRIEGLAVRMAFQLGLHRCPRKLALCSEQEAELRQRILWSLYCIDRSICPRLGLPLAIQDDDLDVCLPGYEEHGEQDHCTEGVQDHKLDLLVLLAGQAEFRGSITSLLYRAAAKEVPEVEHVTRINGELTRWWNEVEDHLELSESAPHQISAFHRMVLLCLRCESIIALNRRAIATTKNSSAYNAALQNCIGAARTIIKTFHDALSDSRNSPAISTPLIWPSFTWAVWMSAFIMIYAANEDQISCAIAIKHADKCLEILRHLGLRGSMWPDASTVAIREMKEKLERRGKARDGSSRTTQRNAGQHTSQLHDSSQRSRDPSQNRTSTRNMPVPTSLREGVQVKDFSDSVTLQTPNVAHTGAPTQSSLQAGGFTNGARQMGPSLQSTEFLNIPHYDFQSDQQFLDLSIPMYSGNDLFYGSDIPFWMGDDQLAGMNGLGSI